jgi:hypothetical protein
MHQQIGHSKDPKKNKNILTVIFSLIFFTGFKLNFPWSSISVRTVKLTKSICIYSYVVDEILFNGHHPSVSLRILFKYILNIF